MPDDSGALAPVAAGVAATSLIDVGLAPSIAMGMTYTAGAHSLALAMANATANQQRGQTIAETALGQVLALILKAGA